VIGQRLGGWDTLIGSEWDLMFQDYQYFCVHLYEKRGWTTTVS
jgi:hypothetical protein